MACDSEKRSEWARKPRKARRARKGRLGNAFSRGKQRKYAVGNRQITRFHSK